VDVLDLDLIIAAFDSVHDTDFDTPGNQPSPNWNAGADLNADDAVDVLDLDLIIQAFDATPGLPNYNAGADFNGDASIDVLDLDIFLRNFDKFGADF
jgi:hypothetical protein